MPPQNPSRACSRFDRPDVLAVEITGQQIVGHLDDVLDEMLVFGMLAVGDRGRQVRRSTAAPVS